LRKATITLMISYIIFSKSRKRNNCALKWQEPWKSHLRVWKKLVTVFFSLSSEFIFSNSGSNLEWNTTLREMNASSKWQEEIQGSVCLRNPISRDSVLQISYSYFLNSTALKLSINTELILLYYFHLFS
jgi:hypothetical protein